MILVVGATGLVGGQICRKLVAGGYGVRALSRATSDGAALGELRRLGVETVAGDLRDRASLDAAAAGAEVVISTASATRSAQPGDSIERTDGEGQLDLVEAARAAGVGHFVYVSFSGGLGSDDPLTLAKRAVEASLPASGMGYTILRPTFFTEVWLSPPLGFDHPGGKVTIYGSGERPISWVSLQDVAEFAVQSVDNPAARNSTVEIGGPDALAPLEVVRIFESVGGRALEVQHVPEEVLRSRMEAATNSLERTFASMMLGYAGGDVIPMQETLARIPVRLRSVREYAESVLAPAAAPADPMESTT